MVPSCKSATRSTRLSYNVGGTKGLQPGSDHITGPDFNVTQFRDEMTQVKSRTKLGVIVRPDSGQRSGRPLKGGRGRKKALWSMPYQPI